MLSNLKADLVCVLWLGLILPTCVGAQSKEHQTPAIMLMFEEMFLSMKVIGFMI